jgi:hypothetical protein
VLGDEERETRQTFQELVQLGHTCVVMLRRAIWYISLFPSLPVPPPPSLSLGILRRAISYTKFSKVPLGLYMVNYSRLML